MADRYWRGGNGTWFSSTTNWSATSGGAGGASLPTDNDDVYIDANSNTGTGAFTITISGTVRCRNISFDADGVCTLARGSSQMNINGSWFNSATNFAITGTGTTQFLNNAGLNGGTINHNGIAWPGNNITFNGVGCTWTLNSNITMNNTVSTITHTAGAIDINGYTWSLSRYTASSVTNARDVYFRTGGSFTMIGTTAADTAINISGTNWRCDCPRANSYNAIAAGATGGFRRSMGATSTMAIGTAVDNASEMYPYNAPNLSITGGASALTLNIYCTVNNLDFTGYTGTPTSAGTLTTTSRAGGFGVFIAGNCTFNATGTYTSLLMSFYRFVDQDTTTATFDAQSKQLADGVAIMLPQATDTTQTTMSISNAPTTSTTTNVVQLVKGRIALSGNWAVGMFKSSYTNVRGIDFDVNRILLNAVTATAKLNAPIITNFDSTGSGGFGQSNNSGGTLTWGTTSGASATTAAPYIATGTFNTGSLDLGGSHFKKIDFGSATTTFPTCSFFLYGDATLGTGTWSVVTMTYYGSGGTDTLTTNSRIIASLTVNAPGSTLSLSGALTCGTASAGGLTLTYGTLQTNDNTLSMNSFTVPSPSDYTRTLALGTSQCPLISTTAATVIYNAPDASNFTITGTGGFTRTLNATATISSHSTNNISSGFTGLPTFTFSAGSGAVTFTTASQIYSLNFTGGTSTVTGSQIQIYGDSFQLFTSGTYTGLNVILRSQGTQNVYGNSKTLGTLQVSGAVSGASIVGTSTFQNAIGCGTFTHSTGGIYLEGYVAITCTSLDSSGSGVRSVSANGTLLGAGWTIATNNATIMQLNATNLTLSQAIYFNLSYAGSVGTRTIALTNFTANDTYLIQIATNNVDTNAARNIYINPAATDTVAIQGAWKDMYLSDGWAGTLSTGTGLTLYGDLTLGSTANTTSTTSALTFAPLTAKNVTTSGRTINFPITFTTASTTSLNFQDALVMSSLRALTITNGGILRLFSGTTNTVGSFVTTGTTMKYLQSSTSGSRATISAASGTLAVTYLSIKDSAATGGAIWNATDPTNVDQGNNTGWLFPVGATGNMFMLF
jgi:hypothetical protein